MKDNIIPDGKWKFDEEVACVFDEMLERSIPDYENMRNLVKNVGQNYAQINSYIVDIGCSDGLAIEPFIRTYGEDFKYLMMDVSEPMLERCRKRFGYENIINYDITKGLPDVDASLVLSILTLQFTPIEYRQKIVQSIYDNLRKGGALILVEKVIGNTNDIDDMLVNEYYKIKADNAYTQKQIEAKRKSLEGVLVPITAKWNENLLESAGFSKIDCFWRYLNFSGWVAVK